MTFDTARRWLTALGLLVTAFGLVMALTSATPLFDVFNRLIDPAFWGTTPNDPGTAAFHAWVYGAWGATLAGWGVTITLLAWEALGRRERWAWWAPAIGVSTWFVLDTTISLLHAVVFNIALNVALFVLAALPLLATRDLASPR